MNRIRAYKNGIWTKTWILSAALKAWRGQIQFWLTNKKGVPDAEAEAASQTFVTNFDKWLVSNAIPDTPDGSWILKQILTDKLIWPEDSKQAGDSIKLFNKMKVSNKFKGKKDIQQFSTPAELYKTLADNQEFGIKTNETFVELGYKGFDLISTHENLELFRIKSFEATKAPPIQKVAWCIKQKYSWDQYSKQGPIYFIAKDGNPYVLFHAESHQIKDVHDNAINSATAEEIFPLIKTLFFGWEWLTDSDFAVFLPFAPERIQKALMTQNKSLERYMLQDRVPQSAEEWIEFFDNNDQYESTIWDTLMNYKKQIGKETFFNLFKLKPALVEDALEAKWKIPEELVINAVVAGEIDWYKLNEAKYQITEGIKKALIIYGGSSDLMNLKVKFTPELIKEIQNVDDAKLMYLLDVSKKGSITPADVDRWIKQDIARQDAEGAEGLRQYRQHSITFRSIEHLLNAGIKPSQEALKYILEGNTWTLQSALYVLYQHGVLTKDLISNAGLLESSISYLHNRQDSQEFQEFVAYLIKLGVCKINEVNSYYAVSQYKSKLKKSVLAIMPQLNRAYHEESDESQINLESLHNMFDDYLLAGKEHDDEEFEDAKGFMNWCNKIVPGSMDEFLNGPDTTKRYELVASFDPTERALYSFKVQENALAKKLKVGEIFTPSVRKVKTGAVNTIVPPRYILIAD